MLVSDFDVGDFRQIVAGTLRGGSKALCQMENEYIGNILYKFHDLQSRVP